MYVFVISDSSERHTIDITQEVQANTLENRTYLIHWWSNWVVTHWRRSTAALRTTHRYHTQFKTAVHNR